MICCDFRRSGDAFESAVAGGTATLCASTVFEADAVTRYPKLMEMICPVPETSSRVGFHVAPTDDGFIGYKGRRLLSILSKKKLSGCSVTCSMRMSF